MSITQTERVIGYLGERSVERFFLLNGVNCRIVEFEEFDAVIITGDNKLLKCQIKTTQSDKWRLTCGKKRKGVYTDDVDLFALVILDYDNQDYIFFYTPDELPKSSKSVSTVKPEDIGKKGWEKVLKKVNGT